MNICLNNISKGFVTIATGEERYYELAYNLLVSYRKHTKNPLPFCIIAEEENQYTSSFDKVIVLRNATRSYIDKLSLFCNIPFDQNIFIDADCLAYKDLNDLFDVFPKKGVSCVGKHYPLDNTTDGYFTSDNIYDYKDCIDYIPDLHGGVIWYKNDETTRRIYHECLRIIPNYSKFKFRYFEKPADEPILALAIAANKCQLIDRDNSLASRFILFRPIVKKVNCDIHKGKLSYNNNGKLTQDVYLCHWGNSNCNYYEYKNEVISLMRNRKFLQFPEIYQMFKNIILCKLYELKIL